MKKFLALLISVITALALTACGNTPAPAPDGAGDGNASPASPSPSADPVVMMIGSTIAEDSAQGMALAMFEELVEERSEGRIDVQLYLNSTLGDARQLCESIQMHTIQGCSTDAASASNFDSNYTACDLPFLFLSKEDAYAAFDGEFGDAMKASSDANGMRVLSYWSNGFRNLSNSKNPVYSPDDVSGMKIRVMEAPLYINVLKAWGANPTPMAFSEVYTALSQKTVDGQDNGPVLTYTNKFYEVQKYYTILEYAYCCSPFMIDGQWFDALDADLQEIIVQADDECRAFEREKEEELCEEYLDKMIAEGLEVNELTAEQKAVFQSVSVPVWDVVKDQIDPEIYALCLELAGNA